MAGGSSGAVSGLTTVWSVVSKTADYIATDGDFVLVDASGGAVTITLPSPAANARVAVKKTDNSGNNVTVDAGTNYIDVSGTTSVALMYQNDKIVIVSDGSNWYVESTSIYL